MRTLQTKTKIVKQLYPVYSEKIKLLSGAEVFQIISDPDFQQEWDNLYQSCYWGTVYQSRPFVSNWYDIYRNEYLPIVVKAEWQGVLTGLLLMAKDKNGLIVGAGANQAEYQVWLASNDNEFFIKEALETIQKCYPGTNIQLRYIPGNAPLSWTKNDPAWRRRCIIKTFRHPLLVINEENIVNHSKKKKRNEIVKRLKRLGELKFERITDNKEFALILDEIAVHYDFRKGAMFNKTVFKSDPVRKKFITALFNENILHTTVLKLNGKIIASNVGATGKNRLHLQGINAHVPFYARYSPGIIHFRMLGQQLLKENIEIFDLTPGGDTYKDRLATEYTHAYTLSIGSSFQKITYDIKSALLFSLRSLLAKTSIRPNTYDKVKTAIRGFRSKIAGIKEYGLYHIFKFRTEQSNVESSKKIYVVSPDQDGMLPENKTNIKRNSLRCLLEFKQVRGKRPTRKEFLQDAMHRFEKEEHCFSWSENEKLIASIWYQKAKLSSENTEKNIEYTDIIKLKNLYYHEESQDTLPIFIASVCKILASENMHKSYFEVFETGICQALESVNITPLVPAPKNTE